ncbi:hypothetical protein SAY86_011070 [Trapa natans]|uniref:Chromatin structure-remodeling complex protein SYD-like n=1 Tax=Trapa natans TaxID=22666 RepID=A0AAN7LWE9_TRANT|nr:hypothetical protein SAY86_011070 [Trapa natans]
MASPQNVELEAAKFLQKLIQESKDEPAKLATKLYVILQHMKSSGKEHSMPYQVISRAMETVISQHGLDIEALKSSRLSLSAGPQTGDGTTSKHTEPMQATGVSTSTNTSLAEHDMSKSSTFASGRAVAGPSSGGHEYYQGPLTLRSNQSFNQESPSSLETRSANSQSQERRDSVSYSKPGNQKDSKKAEPKRKRGDSIAATESHADDSQKPDNNNIVNPRKGKMSKVDASGVSLRGADNANFNITQTTIQMEHLQSSLRKKQEDLIQPNSSLFENQDPATKNHELRNFDPFNAASSSSFQPSDDGRNSIIEVTHVPRSTGARDAGKSLVSRASTVPGTPFNEQQLKQLRAQCLVFLAFRNGLTPKQLHLEIALGNISPRDGSASGGLRQEPDHRGNSQPSNEPAGSLSATHLSAGEANGPTLIENNRSLGIQMHQTMDSQAIQPTELKNISSSNTMNLAANNVSGSLERDNIQNVKSILASPQAVMNQKLNLETKRSNFSGVGEAPGGSFVSSTVREHSKPVSGSNAELQIVTRTDIYNEISKEAHHVVEKSTDEEGEDESASIFLPPPKYTMLEKWIMDRQKKKFLVEQNLSLKHRKTERRISHCFDRLKKTVSLSEDISAKTKSVIELKKLQLLALQRRLRSDFLGDFFKPIVTDMDNLRSFKKHKHGRRIKQIERYEQKMKEEGQRRIRERQKEFFSDIEVHKERLEDAFKVKRERLKGFNKYVKELHKRKERTHREKIDRIQREKITLLKINDVEGYLRMVQDAKSDRVKQLLKETEKYLQKLGSKLQEAKTAARSSEHDAEEIQTENFLENSETAAENDDESDQAKHYKESNEKYYLMAHSIKESIAEQPTMLLGGKLREYQMNGLRWLVSLYNNHLNGILADEMGLGKTVQVISLICYLMENKNDRGPFLVVVPSSVLPGWESEINFWAPAVHKIVYAGPPEERRRLFKEKIVHQKFNVLLTTYEYLMNKHDRPKLSKLHWHYIIIDEGHRIKNASCKLNADLKHYRSSHRLLLTGTPLQNNLEELWALLNFLLPSIFNSSEDFSQWFNKPFESNGDSSAEEALLSEEENLLIINRLHQVLRPFVLRRLKHKVENELPEKIERLIRCEPSAYQTLLMKRVEENLGSLGTSKARSVQNSVMELRNICNHPYLSQLHADDVDNLIPKHYLPPIVRLCGKLEMLDRLLPKLKATDHRVLFFSTMTRLLDVMEEYLNLKHYRYLRLDGHTSGGDRGALIEMFNQPNSPFFIFLLSIRAGGVGVNLQAADTVIIFDTDWNPQVDLQAQARAHRIGQKKDVLVLRFETVQTVEEQVRASAEHKLGVANQSITAGFFDNNTSAEDRREYLESLLRECKKEEDAPVLDDDALNYLIARSESEIDIFESVDKKRHEEEMALWSKLVQTHGKDVSKPLPPRLVTHEDLKVFCEVMKVFETPKTTTSSNVGVKRKSVYGGLDTQHYGRGKRAREVRSYEEQMTEEEFERMCQADSPGSPNQEAKTSIPTNAMEPVTIGKPVESPAPALSTPASVVMPANHATTPAKRGRGRPKRTMANLSSSAVPVQHSSETGKVNVESHVGTISSPLATSVLNPSPAFASQEDSAVASPNTPIDVAPVSSQPNSSVASPVTCTESGAAGPPVTIQEKGQRRKTRMQAPQDVIAVPIAGLTSNSQSSPLVSSTSASQSAANDLPSSPPSTQERGQRRRGQGRAEVPLENIGITSEHPSGFTSYVQPNQTSMASSATGSQPDPSNSLVATQEKTVAAQERGRRRKAHSPVPQIPVEAPRRRGRRKISVTEATSGGVGQDPKPPEQLQIKPADPIGIEATVTSGSTVSAIVPVPQSTSTGSPGAVVTGKEVDYPQEIMEGNRERACGLPVAQASSQDTKPAVSDNSPRGKQSTNSKIGHNVRYVASMMKEILSASKTKVGERPEGDMRDSPPLTITGSASIEVTRGKHSEDKRHLSASIAATTSTNLPSVSTNDQSGGEISGVHEKMEIKVALPFLKQAIEESLEEMPALPPGFEMPTRSLLQNQKGDSFDHGAMSIPSKLKSPVNVADDVRISGSSDYEAAVGLEMVNLGADARTIEVTGGVLNQGSSSEVQLTEDSSHNFPVESKTEALHAVISVEGNNDVPCMRGPASDDDSRVHPEVHGEVQEVLDKLWATGEDSMDEIAKTSCGRGPSVRQPERVENTGADTAEVHSKSMVPELGASLPESVDNSSTMNANLTIEKSAANSPIEETKLGDDEEEMGHQIDISQMENSEVANQKAATPPDSSTALVHVEKGEGLVEKDDTGSLPCVDVCQMDGSEAENLNEKLPVQDYSEVIVGSSSPLTSAAERNDCTIGRGGENLLNEMGSQMVPFQVEPGSRNSILESEEKQLSLPQNLTIIGGSPFQALEMDPWDEQGEPKSIDEDTVKEQVIHPDDSMKEEVVHPDDSMKEEVVHPDDSMKEEVVHPDDSMKEQVVHPDDSMKEQVVHPDDSMCENSLDVAKSDTLDLACDAKDALIGLPGSLAVVTRSNNNVPEPDHAVEPNPGTNKDYYTASEEQLPLSVDATGFDESKGPVPQINFVTVAIQKTADEESVGVKNQFSIDLAVTRDSQFHSSGEEYLDELVKLEIAPVGHAIPDLQENACSHQCGGRNVQPEDSTDAVLSGANVASYGSQNEVEVKPESLSANHTLIELPRYASSNESNVEEHINLSRSELIPKVNESSELAEENVALVEESSVTELPKFLVPEAIFSHEVKPSAAPAYHASCEMQENVALDHIHEEDLPSTVPQFELGSKIDDDSADVAQSKIDGLEANVLEEVITESAHTENAPQECASPGQVTKEALSPVLHRCDMELDATEAHGPVEQQLTTPNDSPLAEESMSSMFVADLRDKAIDTSTVPFDEEAHIQHMIEKSVSEIVEENPVLQQLYVVPEGLKSDTSGAGSFDEVSKQAKNETDMEVLEIVVEHSLVLDEMAVSGELNHASAGAKSPDEVQHKVNEISETVKEPSPQLDNFAITEEPKFDSIGDRSEGQQQLTQPEDSTVYGESKLAILEATIYEENKVDVDKVRETFNEEQKITEPEDSAVLGKVKLAVPEATTVQENKVEVDGVCKTVNEQQKMAEPESGKTKLAVPEATTVEQKMAEPEHSSVSGKVKLDVPEEATVEKMTEPEDSSASGKVNLVVSEATTVEVHIVDVDELFETVNERQKMAEPEDSAVSGKVNLAVPEATTVEVHILEGDVVCETVYEQQLMIQPEDSTVSGETMHAVPGATSQNEVEKMGSSQVSKAEAEQMTPPEYSTFSGESKIAVAEAQVKNEIEKLGIDEVSGMLKEQQQVYQPEDSTGCGELRCHAVPEATSQNEVEKMEVDEVSVMFKGQQQMMQSEDSLVSGELKLSEPEATSQNEVENVETYEVNEMVKEQQWVMRSEDPCISGELNNAEPEAEGKKMEAGEMNGMVERKQQMTQSEVPSALGEMKFAEPEATSQNELEKMEVHEVNEMLREQQWMAQSEDPSVSGESNLAEPEAISHNEGETMEFDEVCETVKQQQQQTSQLDNAIVPGELELPVPEDISKTEEISETKMAETSDT